MIMLEVLVDDDARWVRWVLMSRLRSSDVVDIYVDENASKSEV